MQNTRNNIPRCLLGGGFKQFLCSPLPGEMIQLDSYFSYGLLQPPTSLFPFPYHPCIVYLPTFTKENQLNVGKYTSPMDGVGTHGFGIFVSPPSQMLIRLHDQLLAKQSVMQCVTWPGMYEARTSYWGLE